ncbi:unnamed protein product, partial [Mesorhabditis belari]|uniref:Uncharacterized protein n=1 Tax=Mesorhabditis belari TaxID=2138241 RepID=A0AAF3J6I4_9BILA
MRINQRCTGVASRTAHKIPAQNAVCEEKRDGSPPPQMPLSEEVQDDDTMRGVKSFDEEKSGKEIGPLTPEKAKIKKEMALKSSTPPSSTPTNSQEE